MTASRKRRRSRSAPPLPEPSDNQMTEALIAFGTLKVRYRLERDDNAPAAMRFRVVVVPDMVLTEEAAAARGSDCFTIHRFTTEQSARQWREREIIRETVKVAMRTRP